MTSFIIAGVFIVILIVLVVWGAVYATKPRDPSTWERPLTPCKRCGEVMRVWGDLLSEEPSHRVCDCIEPSTLRWDDWEERQRDEPVD